MGISNLFKSKKQEDQLYGIKDNLVSGIPREYGRGEHHVKLAYITPEEASILKKIDLYDSNPPHDGPKGIPNYNDGLGGAPGQGDAEAGGTSSATGADNAAHGNSGTLGSNSGNVTFGDGQVVTTPGAEQNETDRKMRELARALNAGQLANINANPNLGMGDYNPSPFGISAGLTPTDGLGFGQSLGYQGAQLGEALGNMSPSAIMGGLVGLETGIPGLGFITGLFDDPMQTHPRSPRTTTPFEAEKSLFDKFGDFQLSDLFGPAQPTVETGGNYIPPVASGTIIDAEEADKQAQIDDLISRGFTEELAQRIVDAGKYFASYDE